MTDDLREIIRAAESCSGSKAPKAFRRLAAFIRDHPDPSTSPHRDLWTPADVKHIARALLQFPNYPNYQHEWLDLVNAGALYCEDTIEKIPHTHPHAEDLARFHSWTADFMMHWVYLAQNLMHPNDDWKPELEHHASLLPKAWDSHKQALTFGAGAEFNRHIVRTNGTTGLYTFARHARRAMTYAQKTGDISFLPLAYTLFSDARTTVIQQGFPALPALHDTKSTAASLDWMMEYYLVPAPNL